MDVEGSMLIHVMRGARWKSKVGKRRLLVHSLTIEDGVTGVVNVFSRALCVGPGNLAVWTQPGALLHALQEHTSLKFAISVDTSCANVIFVGRQLEGERADYKCS